MDTDLSNPAAAAWFDTVDESALEATIRPQAVFADVQIQGTVSDGGRLIADEPAPAVAAASTGFTFDPKWIAVLAIVVLAIGAMAVLSDSR